MSFGEHTVSEKTGGRHALGTSNGFGAAHFDAIPHCHATPHHDATPYNNVIFRHYYISLPCNILAITDDTLFSLYYRTLKFPNRSMSHSVTSVVPTVKDIGFVTITMSAKMPLNPRSVEPTCIGCFDGFPRYRRREKLSQT